MSNEASPGEGRTIPTGSATSNFSMKDRAEHITFCKDMLKAYEPKKNLHDFKQNMLNPALVDEIEMMSFDLNVSKVDHFEQGQLESIKDLFPPYDYPIEEEEFFMMTVFLIRILRNLHDLRSANKIQVPPDISAKLSRELRFKDHLEKIWLLCLLGADSDALQEFVNKLITNSPRRSVMTPQHGQYRSSSVMTQSPHSPLNVQRRVNFSSGNEGSYQQIPRYSPTSYIIPPTPAPDEHTFPGYGRVSLQPDPNNDDFVHVITRGYRHSHPSRHDVREE